MNNVRINRKTACILILSACMSVAAGGCGFDRENAIKGQPKNLDKLIVRRGIALLQEGKTEEPLNLFKKAISLEPYNEANYILPGQALMAFKRYDDVILLLTPGVKNCPNAGEIPFTMAYAYMYTGQLKPAFVMAKRALDIYEVWKKDEDVKQTQILLAQIAQQISSQQ